MSDPQPNISRDLLGRGHSPVSASRIFKEKVLDKPLFLRPTEPEPLDARSQRQRERAHELARRRKSQKPKPLTARQKRALGIYEVPREQQKYAIYKPLHAMWCSYMREILGLDKAEGENGSRPSAAYITPQGAGPKIASADFHGAEIEIVRSRCVSRVGLRGIVVKDTKFVFEIITPTNQMKIIPKEHTVFRIEIPISEIEPDDDATSRRRLAIELYGSQLENRAADRANKKFKLHIPPDL